MVLVGARQVPLVRRHTGLAAWGDLLALGNTIFADVANFESSPHNVFVLGPVPGPNRARLRCRLHRGPSRGEPSKLLLLVRHLYFFYLYCPALGVLIAMAPSVLTSLHIP